MSSYANSPDDLRDAMALIATGKLDVEPLITHRLPLERTGEGFAMLADQADCLKVIVNP